MEITLVLVPVRPVPTASALYDLPLEVLESVLATNSREAASGLQRTGVGSRPAGSRPQVCRQLVARSLPKLSIVLDLVYSSAEGAAAW